MGEITLANWNRIKGVEGIVCPDVITCKKCKIPQSKNEFTKGGTYKYGRKSICKKCSAAAQRRRKDVGPFDTFAF